MAASRQVDLLEPIDLSEHLDKIQLYLGQVCQIAGISKMQLDYWTNKAQIPTQGRKQRIYDMDAVETVMLIKQAKDKGLNLGAAIEAARRFRELNGEGNDDGEVRARLRPESLRGLLGRQRVDVDACAELEPGEHGQPRHELEVPVPAGMEPGVRGGPGLRRRVAGGSRRGGAVPRRRGPASVGSAACCRGAITSSYGALPAGEARTVTSPRSAISRPSSRSTSQTPHRPCWSLGSSSCTAGGGSRSQKSCEWLCGRLEPATRPSLSTTWTYGNPSARAASRRAYRAEATVCTSRSSSSASERACRGVCTTTSCRSSAG